MKKTYAIITARKNSKAIKKKNLLKIGKDTLISRSIKILKNAKIFQKIFLSSDSNQFLNIAERMNIIPIKRPKKYSTDTATSEKAVIHFINFLKQKKIILPKYIFIIQPTSPFVNENTLKKALNLIQKGKAASVISLIKTPHKYHYENQRIIKKNNVVKFIFKKKSNLRQKKIITFVHGNIFAVRTDEFIKQKRILAEPIYSLKLKNNWEALDIDNSEDIRLARVILDNLKKM